MKRVSKVEKQIKKAKAELKEKEQLLVEDSKKIATEYAKRAGISL